MATVVLPRALTVLFPTADRRVEVGGATVADVIAGLDARWPGMRDRLRDDVGIRPHVNVFVDGVRAGVDGPVREASVVHVIPAMSGG